MAGHSQPGAKTLAEKLNLLFRTIHPGDRGEYSSEEVAEADLIVQVLDASSPAAEEQAATVEKILGELGAAEKPRVVALNKIDLLAHLDFDLDRFLYNLDQVNPHAPRLLVSARTGEGMERWREWLTALVRRARAKTPA